MIRLVNALVTAGCWVSVIAGGAQIAAAQATGELTGVVRDATGAVVPGVTVTLTGDSLPAPVVTETNRQGSFAISLPHGLYQVRAVAVGFEPWATDVEVTATGATLDVSLQLETVSDRVTVTTTRTGIVDVQTTGIAVTVLDAKALEAGAVERIEHLAGLVPTLSVSQTPGDTPLLTLRGIGSNAAVPGTQPNVTMQIDGVYLTRGPAMSLDFLDVERVEVLRGPQGTLFGRNSIGGTINIVTRQPTNALETRARLTVGDYDKLRVEGGISGPLVRNRVMGSFAFLRGSRDGFVVDLDTPDHPLGSEDTWAGRGQLRIVLGSRSDLLVSSDYSRSRDVPLTLARPLARRDDPMAPASLPRFEIPDDFWSVRPNDLADARNRQSGMSARLTLRLGDTATLSSVTAYRDGDHRGFVDSDTTELPVATAGTTADERQVSQEVAIAQRTARLDWIGGVFLLDEHNIGSIELTNFLPNNQFRLRSTIDTNAWALFGQARYLLSERVAVTGGLRYSHEREQANNTGGVFGRGTSIPLSPPFQVLDAVAASAWTPKASVELKAPHETFLFLSATRGFKRGGVNVTAREPGGTFRPEFAWSYEAGVKRSLPGGRGRVNASVFFVDYRDLQVVSFAGPGQLDVSNAGRARSKGLEVEGSLSPGPGFQLLGTLSWLDAVYGQYVARGERSLGPEPIDATGNRLREAPEWSGSGSAVYEFQPVPIGTVSVRGDVSWQSRVFFSPSNRLVQSQGAYALVHARTSFVPRSRRWDVSAYVRNLGGQEYVTATWEAAGDVAISGRPGEPRQWGIQFTVRR